MSLNVKLTKSFVLVAIASVLAWAGFVIGITAQSSNFWIGFPSGFVLGLWNNCSRATGDCSALPAEPWLDAVRAFMILYVIFIFAGSMMNFGSLRRQNKKLLSIVGGIFSIAATFGMIGASVYTATINQRYSGDSFTYGYGFGGAWGVVGAGYLAGVFNQLSARYTQDEN